MISQEEIDKTFETGVTSYYVKDNYIYAQTEEGQIIYPNTASCKEFCETQILVKLEKMEKVIDEIYELRNSWNPLKQLYYLAYALADRKFLSYWNNIFYLKDHMEEVRATLDYTICESILTSDGSVVVESPFGISNILDLDNQDIQTIATTFQKKRPFSSSGGKK